MTTADEALQIVLDNVAPLGIERCSITEALGRILAEDIHSPRDIPGFDNSAMDGYAVRAADVASASEARPVRLEVLETVAAGAMPSRELVAGQAARTMTGAPFSLLRSGARRFGGSTTTPSHTIRSTACPLTLDRTILNSSVSYRGNFSPGFGGSNLLCP